MPAGNISGSVGMCDAKYFVMNITIPTKSWKCRLKIPTLHHMCDITRCYWKREEKENEIADV